MDMDRSIFGSAVKTYRSKNNRISRSYRPSSLALQRTNIFDDDELLDDFDKLVNDEKQKHNNSSFNEINRTSRTKSFVDCQSSIQPGNFRTVLQNVVNTDDGFLKGQIESKKKTKTKISKIGKENVKYHSRLYESDEDLDNDPYYFDFNADGSVKPKKRTSNKPSRISKIDRTERKPKSEKLKRLQEFREKQRIKSRMSKVCSTPVKNADTSDVVFDISHISKVSSSDVKINCTNTLSSKKSIFADKSSDVFMFEPLKRITTRKKLLSFFEIAKDEPKFMSPELNEFICCDKHTNCNSVDTPSSENENSNNTVLLGANHLNNMKTPDYNEIRNYGANFLKSSAKKVLNNSDKLSEENHCIQSQPHNSNGNLCRTAEVDSLIEDVSNLSINSRYSSDENRLSDSKIDSSDEVNNADDDCDGNISIEFNRKGEEKCNLSEINRVTSSLSVLNLNGSQILEENENDVIASQSELKILNSNVGLDLGCDTEKVNLSIPKEIGSDRVNETSCSELDSFSASVIKHCSSASDLAEDIQNLRLKETGKVELNDTDISDVDLTFEGFTSISLDRVRNKKEYLEKQLEHCQISSVLEMSSDALSLSLNSVLSENTPSLEDEYETVVCLRELDSENNLNVVKNSSISSSLNNETVAIDDKLPKNAELGEVPSKKVENVDENEISNESGENLDISVSNESLNSSCWSTNETLRNRRSTRLFSQIPPTDAETRKKDMRSKSITTEHQLSDEKVNVKNDETASEELNLDFMSNITRRCHVTSRRDESDTISSDDSFWNTIVSKTNDNANKNEEVEGKIENLLKPEQETIQKQLLDITPEEILKLDDLSPIEKVEKIPVVPNWREKHRKVRKKLSVFEPLLEENDDETEEQYMERFESTRAADLMDISNLNDVISKHKKTILPTIIVSNEDSGNSSSELSLERTSRRICQNSMDNTALQTIHLQTGKKWRRSFITFKNIMDHKLSFVQKEDRGRLWNHKIQNLISLQNDATIIMKELEECNALKTGSDETAVAGFEEGETISEKCGRPTKARFSVSINVANSSCDSDQDSQNENVGFCISSSFLGKIRESLVGNHELQSGDSNILQLSLPVLERTCIPDAAREIVLLYCQQSEPLPFETCFPNSDLENCKKIGEGVYGEVFMVKRRSRRTVLKIIPIEGEQLVNGEKQKKFDEILSELVITVQLSTLKRRKDFYTECFAEVVNCRCVYGRYPEQLITLWKEYDLTKGSENDSPKMFKEEQLYIVLELNHGGEDVESFAFNNAQQTLSVFHQVTNALAVAEQAFQFEHRDLHWGNILVTRSTNKETEFVVENRKSSVKLNGVKVTIIDYTLSRISVNNRTLFNDMGKDPDLFIAEGDFQFEIYRLMRGAVENIWSRFVPKTNIYWLLYLLDKLVREVKYCRTSSRVHKQNFKELKKLYNEVLKYNSAYEIMSSC